MCECACVHPRRSRALLWGRGSRTRRGRRFPKQGASEQVPAALECLQRFVIPGKHPVQLFLAPSGGKQRWLIEATWLQSVPRTKPALGSYASPGNGLQGSPRRQAPSRPQEACPPHPPAVERPTVNPPKVQSPEQGPRIPSSGQSPQVAGPRRSSRAVLSHHRGRWCLTPGHDSHPSPSPIVQAPSKQGRSPSGSSSPPTPPPPTPFPHHRVRGIT